MARTLWAAKVKSIGQFRGYCEHMASGEASRQQVERSVAPPAGEGWAVDGFCGVCREKTTFWVDHEYGFVAADGTRTPNLRERMTCSHCKLNTRMRGVLQFMQDLGGIGTDRKVYATEMMTPLFKVMRGRYPDLTGSEYLGDGTPLGGTNAGGIRNEDGTRLTFPSDSFDCLVSLDVLEHIPDYTTALREMARCLRPRGKLLLTAPFSFGQEAHVERARLVSGEIEHLLPPEYHGDPLNEEGGVLCFRHFGWSLLGELRDAGFVDPAMYFYWSRELGYLGGLPFLIMASKP